MRILEDLKKVEEVISGQYGRLNGHLLPERIIVILSSV